MTLTQPNTWLAPIISFIRRVWDQNEPRVRHGIGMAVTIILMWGTHGLLRVTVGIDTVMFGHIPLVYITDFGDLFAFARLFWQDMWKS